MANSAAPATSAQIPRSLAPFARTLWLVMAAVCLMFFAADQVRLARQPIVQCAGPDAGCAFSDLTGGDVRLLQAAGLSATLFASAAQVLAAIARLSLPLVGALIIWRRPDDRVAWLLSLALLSVLLEGAAVGSRWQPVVDAVFAVGVLAWLPVPFVFPNGRLEPRGLRWPFMVFCVVGFVTWTPAVGAWLLQPVALAWLQAGVSVAWPVLAGYSLLYRYRWVATATERQQTKWVLVGFIALFVTSTLYALAVPLFPPWQPSAGRLVAITVTMLTYPLGYVGFAASLAVAILRYRLWDIDMVIRRTLVYALLSGLLALVYLGAVTILQRILHLLSGQAGSLAIVASTLLIAAMFQPLRRRVQTAIDRRFYRQKVDIAQTLAAFAAAARDTTDLEQLAVQLQAVAQETMQPAHTSLWLRAIDPPDNGRGSR